jgi:hypothetical protein
MEREDTVDSLEFVEPLGTEEAKTLIRKILREGTFRFVQHAKDRAKERTLDTQDMVNVLRCGVVEEPEQNLEDGTYRYRVRTDRMTVVIAFRSPTELVVLTGWRN